MGRFLGFTLIKVRNFEILSIMGNFQHSILSIWGLVNMGYFQHSIQFFHPEQTTFPRPGDGK